MVSLWFFKQKPIQNGDPQKSTPKMSQKGGSISRFSLRTPEQGNPLPSADKVRTDVFSGNRLRGDSPEVVIPGWHRKLDNFHLRCLQHHHLQLRHLGLRLAAATAVAFLGPHTAPAARRPGGRPDEWCRFFFLIFLDHFLSQQVAKDGHVSPWPCVWVTILSAGIV